MTDKMFFNGLTNSNVDIIQMLLNLISEGGVDYCLIGGLAVNAYVEPVVSLDFDIVVSTAKLVELKHAASELFEIREFPHSVNLYCDDSDIRIQIQKDKRYLPFIDRASKRKVLGYEMNVAAIEDVMQGKIWAYSDSSRRRSKRQKDLADIFRILETFPHLTNQLPEEISNML